MGARTFLGRNPAVIDEPATAGERRGADAAMATRRAILAASLAALLPHALAGTPAAGIPAGGAPAGGAPAGGAPAGGGPAGGGPAGSGPASQLLYGKPLPLPAVGRWRFGVYYGDYRDDHRLATLDYEVAVDGSRYRLHTEGRASGLIALFYSGVLTQSSSGRLSANGLAPEHYSEQRGSRPRRSLSVDYSTRLVSFAGKPPEPVVPGAQDRLSALIQLGLMARALPDRFAKGGVIALPELTLGDIEKSRYLSLGDSVLETRNGPLRALHLERTAPRGKDDARIEIWLGYDQSMLPVRIRATEDGGRTLDQMVVR